jgi:hypothetical protein
MASQLADAHAKEQRLLRQTIADEVVRLWNGLPDHSDAGLAEFMRVALPLIDAGQRHAISLTDAYYAQEMERRPYGIDADAIIAGIRGDVRPEEVYRRGFVTLWTVFKNRAGTYDTVNPGVVRDIVARVKLDLLLAATHTSRYIATRDPHIYGTWRVVSGTCDLCIDALSNATPQTGLQPVHPGCECAFEPITSSRTARQVLPTSRAMAQQNLRVTSIKQHGEYGPELVDDAKLKKGKGFEGNLDDEPASSMSAVGRIQVKPPTTTARHAISDVNSVHRLPEGAHRLTVGTETRGGRSLSSNAGAYYAPDAWVARLAKGGLRMGVDYQEAAMQHEFGHYLDNVFAKMLRDELGMDAQHLRWTYPGGRMFYLSTMRTDLERMAGTSASMDAKLSAEMRQLAADSQEIMSALRASKEWNGPLDAYCGNSSAKIAHYKSDFETWARAYNEYISLKRGDDLVTAALGADPIEIGKGIQWDPVWFEKNISPLFDKLLRNMGLLKEAAEETLKGGPKPVVGGGRAAAAVDVDEIVVKAARLRKEGRTWDEVRSQLGVTWTDTKFRNGMRKVGYDTSGAFGGTAEQAAGIMATLRRAGSTWQYVRDAFGESWTDTKMRKMLKDWGYNSNGERG